ncbi:MAG: hypothetical protein KF773_17260 [Deltaproteobacteria bacterium]|nr:hypothetical protein [Deltaproteobacteria bacterium]MCW5806079.1 hypothetical protein [Deltaproteobacteria bacterium]
MSRWMSLSLLVAACGRVGFDTAGQGPGDAAGDDGAGVRPIHQFRRAP